MTAGEINVAVLGSTGSIGRSTLEVIAASREHADPLLQVAALAARQSTERLLEQAIQARPQWVVVTDPQALRQQDWSRLPAGTELLCGPEGVEHVAAHPEVPVVVSAIVGSAGLRGTWAALEAGKTVALANKETLVVAGGLVTELAQRRGATLLPVDSEHSAVFQALQGIRRQDVRRVVLTASGGPFRNHTPEQLKQVTVAEALAHPTWDMGPKITVDSATMMNKALEIIEARWLFDLSADQIGVVIHPQSVVHALVETVDGSILAQLSPPDMRLPIQYALTYPRRRPCPSTKLDWTAAHRLEFFPPDLERFPAVELGLECARRGGTTGAVVNAANEEAVARFLAGELPFHQIVPLCRRALEEHPYDPHPTLERLLELDRWARQEVLRWTSV